MTDAELSQQQHDLAEIQEHIDEYADSKAAWSEDPIDWFVKCHAELDAEETAVVAKRDFLKAAIDRESQGMLSAIERKRGGLNWKHKEETIQLVAEQIEGKKERHVKTFHGRVGFRKTVGTKKLHIHDPKAIAKAWPGLVTTEPVIDKKALKDKLLAGGRCPEGAWLDETEGYETFYIDTGKKQATALPKQGGRP